MGKFYWLFDFTPRTWHYSHAPETDGTVAASPEVRFEAMWLMARGHAAVLTRDDIDGRVRIPWLQKAFAAAESQSVRSRAVRGIAETYGDAGQHAQGASLIESVIGQFDGPAARELAALRDSLRRKAQIAQARTQEARVKGKRAAKESRLRYYQRRLAVARAKKDAETARSLVAAIRELERELGKANRP